LHGRDKINELKSTIDILVEAADPINDVAMLDFDGTVVLAQEDSEVVSIDFTVGILVNHSENRQDGVVKTTDKLLFEQFDFLQSFDFTNNRLKLKIQISETGLTIR